MIFFNRRLSLNQFFVLVITLILTVYQLIRVIGFANVYGGIEHDSGWFLGASRSLAERGQYTALVSTIENPAKVAGIDVDQKFNIQDSDGRIWFFTGNGTGPGSIIPNALVIRLFGTGFWALRAGPLLFYTLLLLIAAYAMYRLVGWGAVVLFHLFLFFYPRLSIFLSYEAMGEVTAMFYIILAYFVFALAVSQPNRRWRYFMGAGLIGGLAISTKLLALLSVSGILIWAGWLYLSRQNWVRLKELIILSCGMILPQFIYELIQLIVLVRLTNLELYLRHAQQRLVFVLDDGSGLGLRVHSGAEFMWRKFFMLAEISNRKEWVVIVIFTTILLGGIFLWLVWHKDNFKIGLVAPIWLGWLMNTFWFVSLAKTGWPRHFWFGLILAVMLLCVITFALIQLGWHKSDWQVFKPHQFTPMAVGMLLLVFFGWAGSNQPYIWGFFLPKEIVPYWLEQRFDYINLSGLPWILIPRQDETAVVDYINHMPLEANVYYPALDFGHKAAEIAVQTGRIQYPFTRRGYPGVKAHPADVLIIPSSIISEWRFSSATRQELLALAVQTCPEPVLKNENYILCLADKIRLPDQSFLKSR